MPDGEPFNLVVGIVIVVIGTTLGLGLVVTMVREFRRRNRLLVEGPDVEAYDRDIRRYTQRVWLMVAEWRERLEPEAAGELNERWEHLLERIEVFHAARKDGDETADDVASLVQAEDAIEAFIAANRRDS